MANGKPAGKRTNVPIKNGFGWKMFFSLEKSGPCSGVFCNFRRCNITHRIHVWYIHLHLVDFYGKCRWIYHTWILWVKNQILLMRWHSFYIDVFEHLSSVCWTSKSKLFHFLVGREDRTRGKRKPRCFLGCYSGIFLLMIFCWGAFEFMSFILQRFLEFAVAPAEHFLHIFLPVFSGILLRGAAPKSHENEFICWVSQTIMVWGEKYPLAN